MQRGKEPVDRDVGLRTERLTIGIRRSPATSTGPDYWSRFRSWLICAFRREGFGSGGESTAYQRNPRMLKK